MIRNLMQAAALLSILALAQCSGGSTNRSETASAEHPVKVKIETVSTMTTADGFEATGTVRSKTITQVSAKVMGYVDSVEVRTGDRVKAGALLVSIDPRDAKAQVAQAEAGLAEANSALEEVERSIEAARSAGEAAAANAKLAESTFKRFEALLSRKSVSQQEYDEVSARNDSAQAQLRRAQDMLRSTEAKRSQTTSRIAQAKAGLDQARLFLSYCRVQAPFAGVISEKQVDLGQLASPGVPLVTLEDAENFEARVDVPESRVDRIPVGQQVGVRIDSLGRTVTGKVIEIVPRSDPGSRSVTVKIRLPYSPGLHSGIYAVAQFEDPGATVLSIPSSSLIRRGQLVGLYFVNESNHATFRLIKIGRELGDRVEVLSGVSLGDRVVVAPSDVVRDGSPVEISALQPGAPDGGHVRFDRQTPIHSLEFENC